MGQNASIAPSMQSDSRSGSLKRSNSAQSKSFALSSSSKDENPSLVESLKAICRSDGGRRACMKYFFDRGLGSYFHLFCITVDFSESSRESEISQIMKSVVEYVDSEKNISAQYLLEWQNIVDLIALPTANIDVEHQRFTVAGITHTVIRRLCTEFDGLVNSETYKAWDLTVSQQERQSYIPPVKKGLIKYGSCPNPRSSVHAKIARATAWIGETEIDSNARVKNFAVVFPNILVIDDSLVSTNLSRKSLQNDGHAVRTAPNGRAGFEMFKSDKFDIVIADIFMPILDGYATLELLKAHDDKIHPDSDSSEVDAEEFIEQGPTCVVERWKHSPILIAMSADDDVATVQRAFRSGADFFMCKPLTMEKLADLLL